MEMAQAIISAAEDMNAAVILQSTPGTVRYAGYSLLYAMVKALAERTRVDVALHLDHGENREAIALALEAGYSSVMIDGSALPLDDNIALTANVVTMANECGIPVEGELGALSGKEDDKKVARGIYTDPDEAAFFVKKTGVQSLAIAIGTAHGVYAKTPVLDIGRLRDIRTRVDIPLVLHGASGLSIDDINICIEAGINKINFATDLRIAFTQGVREYLSAHPSAIDPKSYNAAGYAQVKVLVKKRINLITYKK
jgi:tagatose 1,6-diphosphate aldolase GatY/KbaY